MQGNAYRSSKKFTRLRAWQAFDLPRSPRRIRLGPGVPDLPEPFAIGRELARRIGKHVVERQALNFSGDERVDRAAHVFGAKSREAKEVRLHAPDSDERALFLFGSELSFVWCHWWVSIFDQPSLFSRRGCARVLANGLAQRARGRRARWRDSP